MVDQCSTCFYGQRPALDPGGNPVRVCRYEAPQAVNKAAGTETAWWKPVADIDWCGDGASGPDKDHLTPFSSPRTPLTGPQGGPGPVGPAGPDGPIGPPGPIGPSSGFVSDIFDLPGNGDYRIIERMPYGATITSFAAKTSTGTVNIAPKINGVAVPGGPLIAGPAQTVFGPTAGNVVHVGDVVSLGLTGAAAPANLSFVLAFSVP